MSGVFERGINKKSLVVGNRVKLHDDVCGEIIRIEDENTISMRIDKWFLSVGSPRTMAVSHENIKRVFSCMDTVSGKDGGKDGGKDSFYTKMRRVLANPFDPPRG